VSLFVTAAFFAAVDGDARHHSRAREILAGGERLIASDHVLVGAWL